MARQGKGMLGAAFCNDSVRLAELSANGEGCRLVRAAEFRFKGPDALQDPITFGKELAQFLRQNSFKSSDVIFGMPAQWLMIREKSFPAASHESLSNMLMLQAEQDFSLEPAALTLDYLSGTSSSQGQAVMLMAVLNDRVLKMQRLALTAGLKLQALTATSLAISAASQHTSILYFGTGGIEMVSQNAEGLPLLKYVAPAPSKQLPIEKSQLLPLSGELRRAIVLSSSSKVAVEWAVSDDLGISSAILNDLSNDIQTHSINKENFSGVDIQAKESGLDVAGAVALALYPNLAAAKRIDFVHARTTVKPPSRVTSQSAWRGVAAAVALVGIAYLVYSWQQGAEEVEALREKRDEMKDQVTLAQNFIDHLNGSTTWYEKRPNYLECLRAITLCFPQDGHAWSSSLSLRDNMKGVLTGRATDEKSVLDVIDKLKTSHAITDIKMLNMRGAGGKTPEVSFAVSFTFVGVEPSVSPASASPGLASPEATERS